ncbi:hypothetical protein Nepgr_025879 [Nepenthes gracilis]|uniref:Transcription factor RAX3 n=1 Tax=Nepenthes gracilis TaxID=150966 RepID=A0AAD3T8P2_NEPGR|nr:hypothetical protein Nepgr_025879 [Nepenthes gracilis]
MGRAPCCDKANVKKGPWSPEEDAKLKSYIEQHGTGGNWIALPQKIGLNRCGKSCRLRWLNYLRPNIKHGGFSDEEENIICSLYITIGSRWSIIAAQLPGRTDNDIKNYWNTRLKKKLLAKQRKQQASRALIPMINQQPDQLQYRLEQPSAIPTMGMSRGANLEDQQLKKMVMKLEQGTVQDQAYQMANCGMNYPYLCLAQDQMFIDPMNLTNHNTPTQWENIKYYGTMHEPLMAELEELMYGDGFGGVESCSNVGMAGSIGGAATSAESTSWGDISSLVYPPVVSNYDACQ